MTITTVPHPISLSDEQLAVVMGGASHVAVAWRCRYLELIADQLTAAPITDDAIRRAVVRSLERIAA